MILLTLYTVHHALYTGYCTSYTVSCTVHSTQYFTVYTPFPTNKDHHTPASQVVPHLDENALNVGEYVKDENPPRVVATTYNQDSGIISFVMSEPVNVTHVDTNSLTVQLAPLSLTTASSYTLKVSSLVDYNANTSDPNYFVLDETITIQLSHSDQNEIKSRNPLATSRETTWFSFLPSFVHDFNTDLGDINNINIATVTPMQAIGVDTYIDDTTRPTVHHSGSFYFVSKSISLTFNPSRVLIVFNNAVSKYDILP